MYLFLSIILESLIWMSFLDDEMTAELGTAPALQNLSSVKEVPIFCHHLQCVEWLTIWSRSWLLQFLFPLHHHDIRPVTANCETVKLCFKGPTTLGKITANNNCSNSTVCIQPDDQYYYVNNVPSIRSLIWLYCQLFLEVAEVFVVAITLT